VNEYEEVGRENTHGLCITWCCL